MITTKTMDRIRSTTEYQNAIETIQILFHYQDNINESCSSYGLKHICEDYLKSFNFKDTYISNDAFIAAMVDCGYTVKEIHNSPNFFFNVNVL